MPVRGRKPKPPELKRVLGNPGNRPITEVRGIETGPATKPPFLDGRASKLWDQYAPTLELLETLRAESTHLLAILCALIAQFEDAPNEMSASKIAQIRFISSMLGMDPSSQARMAPKPAREPDPADEFFTGPHVVG